MQSNTTKPSRFLMIGGFLGAGKTTAIARLARHYVDAGKRVALVTNDQAYDLVDTQTLRAAGFDVGEVPGACFCCKFDDLIETVAALSVEEQPDVIIAEPVGSCTDLVATVLEPLRQLYGQQFEAGRLAVLLKPEHGQKILRGEGQVGFSPKAAYIFLKQLEEADVVVINKIDKLSSDERDELVSLVKQRFADKEILAISARDGNGFEKLIAAAEEPSPVRSAMMEVDYDIYAEGEAELGWLNCKLTVASEDGSAFSLDELLLEFIEQLRASLESAGAEPVHLKIFATGMDRDSPASVSSQSMAVANLVAAGQGAELSKSAVTNHSEAELIVNARVAVDPERLTELVTAEVARLAERRKLRHELSHVQSFRPGRPVPTHRLGQ